MKKLLSLAMVLVLALGMLSGCGGDKKDDSAYSGSQSQTSQGSSSSGSEEKEVYELVLGTTCSDPALAPEWNCFGHNIGKFIELTEEYTDGQVIITPYYQSVLGGDTELFQALVNGEIDFYYGNGFATADPRFAWTGLPFIWTSTEQIRELFANPEGELFKLNQEIYNEHGVMNLGQNIGMARGVSNAKHPVHVPEDLNDLIIRTYEDTVVNTFFGGLCTVAVMPASEVYTSMQTGAITGAENSDTVFLRDGFNEMNPYFTYLNWQVSMYALKCNKAMFDGLPEDLQEAVWQASWDAAAYADEINLEEVAKAQAEMESRGVEVVVLTEEEQQQWIEYAQSLAPTLSEAIGVDLYNQIMEIVG